MADDIKIDEGAGPAVATDEVGSKHYQYVKPAFGANNTATIVSPSDPLPTVDSAGNTLLGEIESAVDGTEALLTTIDADTGAIKTAVETIDNAIAGNEMQVDVVGALPAGTNAIGKLAANSGVDIGDVDVTSLPSLPAGSNNIGQVDPRGNVAHDSADSGNPVKVGARARTALPTAVAQDDRTDNVSDKHGRLLVTEFPRDQKSQGRANLTNTTATEILSAAGASTYWVVTGIHVQNHSSSVNTKVEIIDHETTRLIISAYKEGGGAAPPCPPGGFFISAEANKAVKAKCATTGSDVEVFISGYKVPA